MVSAISSPTFSGSFDSGPSIAGLQAQLERCQQQLSDNVNCDSANTREGRQTIQELSGKISEIKARIEKTQTENARPPAYSQNVDTTAVNTQNAAAAHSVLPPATPGALLNVYV